MASVHFLYRSVKPKAKLEVRLQHTENSINYLWNAKTQIETTAEFWKIRKSNTRDREVKKEQIRVNDLCGIIEDIILNAFDKTTPEAITKDWLQNQIENFYNPNQELKTVPKDLLNYIDYYIECKRNDYTPLMVQKIKVFQTKLQRFQNYRKKPILIKDINEDFKNEFVDYCKANHYGQNTIHRDFVHIKTFCKHAYLSGIDTHRQLSSITLEKAKTDSIYLSIDELKKIGDAEMDGLLNDVRDWLIISACTGQRVSDFMRFTSDMIKDNFINFTQKKTNNSLSIPIHPKVKDILEKREGQFPPALTLKEYNENVKTVCKIAEINETVKGSLLRNVGTEKDPIWRKETKGYKKYELVSSHVGRRSFATNHYGKAPTPYIMSVTGHKSEKVFIDYVKIPSNEITKEMINFFQNW